MSPTTSHDPSAFVANTAKVIAIYGGWPTFHDAEVVSLSLDRGNFSDIEPSMVVRVWTFKVHRDQTDSNGYYRTTDYSIVTFRFNCPDEWSVEGFNHQNVLAEITFEFIDGLVHVTMCGLYGIHAAFRCSSASVEAVELLGNADGNTVVRDRGGPSK